MIFIKSPKGESIMGMIYKDTLTKLPNTCAKVHNPIEKSECFGFTGEDGQKYFQLDSYGSKTRKNPNQKSQQTQFDRECALYLTRIFIDWFDLKQDLDKE